jgi:GWxTD domain-containing protein
VTLSQNFTIHAVSPALAQSDIRLLGHIEATTVETVWVRNGQRMTPLPYDWYRDDLTFLYFYNELYHSDVGLAADFYISYAIVPARDPEHILLQGFKRLKPKPVNFIVQAMDISGLTSGEYILRVGVYDKARTLRSETETIFIRSNPEADRKIAASADRYFDMSFTLRMPEDSVRYALRALAPVISQIQVPVLNYLLKEGELENQRRFLHQYFVETDLHDPEGAYIAYMELVAIVDKEYHSAFGYGFETDRGRILLKYGMPDDIIAVDDEPSAPPYEIWFYHAFPVTSQSDVRFLFYNPSLAGGDYQLLHSTAIGELQNNRWQQELYRDALSEPGAGDFIDARDVQPNWNRRAVEYFRD